MKPLSQLYSRIVRSTVAVLLISSFCANAAPRSGGDAANAVQGWLKVDPHPFGNFLPSKIKRTETIKDASGSAIYHVVHLSPQGYVVVSADDAIEPIIAFSSVGDFDSSATQGITPWVNHDLSKRMAHMHTKASGHNGQKAHQRWQRLLAASPNPPPDMEINNYATVVSEVMVAPFLQTLWNQQGDQGYNTAVYNYYVPPGPNGNINNYPCGCVATAMAQMMYYFHYPTTGVGTGSHSYSVNGTATSGNLRGGDGNGGAYQWSNMPLAPNNPTTAQAEEIGDLCYDAGISVGMDYGAGGSSSSDESVGPALTGVFGYSYSDYALDMNGFSQTNLISIINPNLDARLPVSLGIYSSSDGGHEVLADGYGYSGSTLFHHLNMGWGGADSVWYQLPIIDTQDNNGEFTIVDAAVYNVYTNGTGMIISGRIVDPNGVPVVGATITATGGGTYTTTTDTNGIYALIKLPASTKFSITAALSGYNSVSGSYSTGTYVTGEYVGQPDSVANYWGANFVMTRALLVTPENGFAAIGRVGGPFSITSQSYTLANSTGSSINWAASTAPSWLTLSSTSGSVGPNTSAGLAISLSAAASGMSAGTNFATIWITNKTTMAVQALQFAFVAAAADYPIAVTGFNDDVVVETSATGGDSFTYADTFDINNNNVFTSPTSFCFYESGLTNVNQYSSPPLGTQGLPQNGYFTSAVDNKTVFQFGPYAGFNVLALSTGNPSGTLTFVTPTPCKSLSILAATAEGGGTGTFVVNFTDGSSSSSLSFNAANYFVQYGSPGSGAALSQFGLLLSGDYNYFYSAQYSGQIYPVLYQTSVSLAASLTNKMVKSITFTMPSAQGANAVTGVFAVSGSQSVPIVSGPFGFLTSKAGMYYSGGQFVLEVTNAAATSNIVIWDSTNLTAWTAIYTNSSGASSFSFTDTTANIYPHRFYRASKN